MHATTPEKTIRFTDTETTGTDPHKDRIISLGLVEIENGRIGKTIEWFFNPGDVEIHPDAVKVHGITKEFLKDKPPIRIHLAEIMGYLHDAVIGGHNIGFDLNFLEEEFKRNKFPSIKAIIAGTIDTMKIAKEKWPGSKASLDAVCVKCNISTAHRKKHGALMDAELSAMAYLAMNKEQMSMFDTESETASAADIVAGAGHEPMPPILVVMATVEEVAAHEACLSLIEEESKNKPVWRQIEADAVATETASAAMLAPPAAPPMPPEAADQQENEAEAPAPSLY